MSKFVIGIGALLFGCSGEAPDAGAVDEEEQAIVGGTIDTQHASVGVIQVVRTSETGKVTTDRCTGTLVAPAIVLTAAHCVSSSESRLSGWKVSFEPKASKTAMANAIAANRALAHPDFGGSFGGPDVALLFLERSPPGLRPMPIVSKLGAVVGKKVTFVGYGTLGESRDGQRVKANDDRRKVTVPVSEISSTYVEYLGKKGFCGGDSGGPALMTIDGVERIVGVNVLADIGCDANGASVRIDTKSAVREFLEANLPSL